MSTVMGPASEAEALKMLASAAGFLADADWAQAPAEALAECLRALEQADAVEAAAHARMLQAFDAKDGHLADGQRNTRTWLVHCLRVTRGQAGEYGAVQALAREHRPLLAGLRGGHVTKSVTLQLAKWTRVIPAEYRGQAEEILVAASRAGADLRALAAICAEIRSRTAPPDPEDENDPRLDRALSLETTLDGAGVLRGDLTPECSAMVQAVLDALSAPQGRGDLRTRPQRYHDALAEAMRRLLSSGLLPQRAGQPAKALVHIHVSELVDLDAGSVLQDRWIAAYRARWAAQRAAASVSPGDGGAWLDGDAARVIAFDAMTIPIVDGDIDLGAIEELIGLCVQFHRLREQAAPDTRGADIDGRNVTEEQVGTGSQDSTDTGHDTIVPAGLGGAADRQAAPADRAAEVLAMLEHQILGTVIKVVSGPGGVASFLRRSLLGKGLNGPSLPLDVGQTDDIPVHLRRLVDLRDQHCQFPGGCDQPAAGCEPHHVVHRADGGRTSLANLTDYCHWHHHVVLHQMGWALTMHPDGTSQARSPGGKIIRSHGPPSCPGSQRTEKLQDRLNKTGNLP